MTRNLKALGLALVAVFAMSAMAAAGAHAEKVAHFEIGAGTVKLDLVSAAPDNHYAFVAGGKTFTCKKITGHVDPVTPGTLPTELTATGVGYDECHTTMLGLSFPTTVTQAAGCHYTFTAGTWTNATKDAHGSVHICASTIHVYKSASHLLTNLKCQIHVPAQTISGVTYTNGTTEGKMAVTVETSSVAILNTTITNTGQLGCNAHETVTTTFTGSFWLKGTDINKAFTDVTVMGTP